MVWGTFFRDEVPQSARLSAGGGAIAKRAMPECLLRYFSWGFPKSGTWIKGSPQLEFSEFLGNLDQRGG